MFITKKRLIELYEKIENNTATEEEKFEYEFNLSVGCLEKEFVVSEIKQTLKEKHEKLTISEKGS